MSRPRKFTARVGVGVWITALLFLSGCAASEVLLSGTPRQFVGVWRNSHGAAIELKSDGHFTAWDWPPSMSSDSHGKRFTGTWDVQSSVTSGGPAIAMLNYDGTSLYDQPPGEVGLVKIGSGRIVLCADPDPDDPCYKGILERA